MKFVCFRIAQFVLRHHLHHQGRREGSKPTGGKHYPKKLEKHYQIFEKNTTEMQKTLPSFQKRCHIFEKTLPKCKKTPPIF